MRSIIEAKLVALDIVVVTRFPPCVGSSTLLLG